MKKTKILLLLIIILLTGCYDKKELNKIAIVTATEINKTNDIYTVTVEIVNPKLPNDSSENSKPYVIYTGTGKTVQEAYRKIKLSSPRYLYPEHLEVLIINEEIAKKDITEVLDFYLRSPYIRGEFYILIGKDNNILNQKSDLISLSSTSIVNTLKTNNKYQGVANIITLNELASDSINPNKEIILPSIKKNKDTYELDGLAIFKNNKLIDYLTKEESITYNIIKNNTTNSILTYECEKNKYLTIELINSISKIKPQNNKINININMDTSINESNCNINLNDENNLKLIKNKLENYFNNRFNNDINNIRYKYNSDVFGFLDEIYKHDYKTYKKVSNNWYTYNYKTIDLNIKTDINIVGIGKLMEEINEKN